MKRDMDAIRKMVLALRDADGPVRLVEGVNEDVFKFSVPLMIEAGLAEGKVMPSGRSSSQVPAAALLTRLTWEGHEFADSIEPADIWEKAKKHIISPAVPWTFDMLKTFLKHEMNARFGFNGPS